MQLNPKHIQKALQSRGKLKTWRGSGRRSMKKVEDENKFPFIQKPWHHQHLLSIYIRAAPCDQRFGNHIFIYHCLVVTSKRKIFFRLLKVVIGRENRFDGSRWFELFLASTFLRARFLLSSYFYFFPHISKRFKIVCEYEIDFLFLLFRNSFKRLGIFHTFGHGQGYETRRQGFEMRYPFSELNLMHCNSDLFRQHAVNCDKIHKKSLTM